MYAWVKYLENFVMPSIDAAKLKKKSFEERCTVSAMVTIPDAPSSL